MNTRTEKQQRSIERLLIAAIAAVILCGLITPVLIAYWIVPASMQCAPPADHVASMPDNLKQYAPPDPEGDEGDEEEETEEEEYSQNHHTRTGYYNPDEWETVPEPVDM